MNITRNNLTIRNATPADAEQLCVWWNDGAIMAHAGFPNGTGEKPDDIRESLTKDTDETHRRCIIEQNGKPVGEMNYRNIGGGTAEIGIKICDFSNHEKGMGTALLSMFIDELFTRYGYAKIVLDTNVKNTRAQHVYEKKLGFTRLRVNENAWRDQLGEFQSSIDYELTKTDWLKRLLYDERFPRASKYDPMWILNNQMGPNPLWLAEFLSEPFDIKPDMRVLDLGCGKGITSVFLAREYGARVYAVDLWEPPDEKWENAKTYGVEHIITPIHADARELPFAKGFFDAIICVDSYFYYGKDDAFLSNILKFLRPGGKIGMIIPGYMKDVSDGVPAYLEAFLGDELWTWETLEWWRNLWEKDGLVTIEIADTLQDGCALWQRWDETLLTVGKNNAPDEIEDFKTDKGEYMGFIRLVAVKK